MPVSVEITTTHTILSFYVTAFASQFLLVTASYDFKSFSSSLLIDFKGGISTHHILTDSIAAV